MSDPDRRNEVLAAIGIDRWVPKDTLTNIEKVDIDGGVLDKIPSQDGLQTRDSEQLPTVGESDAAPANAAAAVDVSAEQIHSLDWQPLEALVAQCTQCELHTGRTRSVFGVGNRSAEWLVIGEAPGQQEDLQGEPFVGRAGLLLNNMLIALGFPREQVYIANVVKCRPPGNRDPKPEETAACHHFLKRQVALLDPKIILVVGRIAAQSLLNTTVPVGKLRGSVHRFPETSIPMIVTYHPAYLLRRPSEKSKSWQDLKLAMETYREC